MERNGRFIYLAFEEELVETGLMLTPLWEDDQELVQDWLSSISTHYSFYDTEYLYFSVRRVIVW